MTKGFIRSINANDVQRVLNGNEGYLICAFRWSASPQGYDYWACQQHDHLTIRAKQRLRRMLRDYRAELRAIRKEYCEDMAQTLSL